MKSLPNDMIIITYSDLKRLFFRHFSKIKLAAIFCGLAVFGFLLLREPVYFAEATFKQIGKRNDVSNNMTEIFQQMLPLPTESGTMSILRSNEMLKDVVQTMGLQVRSNPDFFLVKGIKRIWENMSCELAGTLSDPDTFAFNNVSYDEEKPLKLFIKLKGEGNFQLFGKQKQLVAEGKIGQPISIQNAAFTLKHIPKNAKIDRFYSIIIEPWVKTVAKVKSKFEVRPSKSDKNILQLSFLARDRNLASALLNQVMLSYQKYLRRENEELCQMQLAYLESRQKELIRNFDQALAEHVAYLMENIGENGFMGFAQELEILSDPKNLYTSKLFDVDVELGRCLSLNKSMLAQMSPNEMDELKEKSKEKLQFKKSLEKQKNMGNSTVAQMQLEKKNQIDDFDLEQKRLNVVSDQPLLDKIEQVNAQIIEQLGHKHEMLNENLALQQQELDDFSGLSLETAQRLMIEYTRQRDTIHAEMKELLYLRERLARPDFELSSLGVVINDPVTNELIQKASTIALQLKDNNNRSEREQERLLDALKTQKTFLSQYIFQTVDLKKLRSKLLEDKIASLRRSIVDLLKSEKELLGQKLQEINLKMGDLPEKWRRESLLSLKKEVGSMMIQAVTQLAETKSLSQHTFQVGSKPLDPAIPPMKPKSSKLFLLSIIAAVFGGASFYFVQLCRTLLKGLPVAPENLKLSGFPVSGSLDRYCNTGLSQMKETDLETLRHVAEFLSSHLKSSEALNAVCIGGKYFDYSKGLAEMLAMRGLKVLVIQYVFDQVVHTEETPGLWQYINGQVEILPIRHQLTYDYLPSGGTTRHAAEFVSNPKFLSLLSEVKHKYDVVLLFSSADAAKAEGLAHLKIADAAVITVQQEKKEELFAYCEWSQKKGADCTTFIYAEEIY